MGHRPFLVGGARLLYAVAGLWFLLVPGAEPDYLGAWLPGLVLSGLSVGMVLPSLAGAAVSRHACGSAVNHAPDRRRAGRGDHGAAVGQVRWPRGFRSAVRNARGAGVADGLLCLAVDTRPTATPAKGRA